MIHALIMNKIEVQTLLCLHATKTETFEAQEKKCICYARCPKKFSKKLYKKVLYGAGCTTFCQNDGAFLRF